MTSTKEIRDDCEAELCPDWVPQTTKDVVWKKAWEDGHAYGACEVKWHYDDLMDIVRTLAPTDNKKEGQP